MRRIAWWASLLLGLVAVAHAEPDPFAKVQVAFESEPSGARITVLWGDPHPPADCIAPCTLALPPWPVMIAAGKSGYAGPVERIAPLEVRGPVRLTLSDEPPDEKAAVFGSGGKLPSGKAVEVLFETEPTGARVRLYGPSRRGCTTPCALEVPYTGGVVAFTLDGHMTDLVNLKPRAPRLAGIMKPGEGTRLIGFSGEGVSLPSEAPAPVVRAKTGPVEVSGPCDRAAIARVLRLRARGLDVCHTPDQKGVADRVTVVVQMRPGGRIARVFTTEGPSAQTPFGTCLARWFKRVKLPGHATGACRVTVPVRFASEP